MLFTLKTHLSYCYKIGTAAICLLFTACHPTLPKNASLTKLEEIPAESKYFNKSLRQSIPRYQTTSFFNYEELVELSKNPDPSPETKEKLERFFTQPIVSNEAYYKGKRPRNQRSEKLGEVLRVATWNIEKSLSIREVAQALTSETAYQKMLNSKKIKPRSKAFEEAMRQRERLATADVIFLQEMDIGISRSDYLDAARYLSQQLEMNYAYAPQALEVDPVLLGTEDFPTFERYIKPDTKRYKGVFGSAVLSKFPILKAEVQPLQHQAYDWYHQELHIADFVEKTRRLGSVIVFENIISRELKIGGRHYFRVDIAVPKAPHQRVSLINNHLEIKTLPKDREKQMLEILAKIQDIPHPVIMAGDHNSAPNDLSATSLHKVLIRTVDDPTRFLRTVSDISGLATGTVIPFYRERGLINGLKNFQNPLARHVPIIFPNPVRGLFKQVEKHRFSDGSTFDFRGDPERSINGMRGTLSNSNEKQLHGHQTTFYLKRPIGPIGRYKLDWFFIKSGELKHSKKKNQPFRFAPHYGETLETFNTSVVNPFSDHHPMVVDLPYEEPNSD